MEPSKALPSPALPARDPSLSKTRPTTSHHYKGGHHVHNRVDVDKEPETPFKTRCFTFLYNKEKKTFCGRTCRSWFYIILYSIVYLCFLTTYTTLVLYGSLWCVRLSPDFETSEKIGLYSYSEHGIGMSITPVSESYQPLIWFRKGVSRDYEKYLNALDDLLVGKRKNRNVAMLGPCGVKPYGYDKNEPCIIVRINKQLSWAGKPLESNSSLARIAPVDVQNWMKTDKKLWLHCEGYHPYDREHVGRIRYYPDPPGFDPREFPLREDRESPLVAMQISRFTLGVSLAVECKLWYANGPSSIHFIFFVAPDDKTVANMSRTKP